MKSITSEDIAAMAMYNRFCRATVFKTFVQLGGTDRLLEKLVDDVDPVYAENETIDYGKMMEAWKKLYEYYGHMPFQRLENWVVNVMDNCRKALEMKDWTIKRDSLKGAFVILYHFEGFLCSIIDVYNLDEHLI